MKKPTEKISVGKINNERIKIVVSRFPYYLSGKKSEDLAFTSDYHTYLLNQGECLLYFFNVLSIKCCSSECPTVFRGFSFFMVLTVNFFKKLSTIRKLKKFKLTYYEN